MIDKSEALSTLTEFREAGLLTPAEYQEVDTAFLSCFAFADAMLLADSLHVNIKVDDIGIVPAELVATAQVENAKDGYIKYAFPSGMNVIFSAIDISQDDLIEARTHEKRPRPYLDHLGIDLRQETEPVKNLFAALPYLASKAGWGTVPQGGNGKAVFCCHVQVNAKHWVFPNRSRTIPLEFAYGPLVINEGMSGCDLRPANPQTVPAELLAATSCHG
jgi:hypothetical protein